MPSLNPFPAGVSLGVKNPERLCRQHEISFLKREGAKQLGGFGTIGSIFPATWDWHQFWYMTAFLSIILAFHEHPPYPRIRRWPRALPLLRDDSPPQTERQVYGIRPDDRYDSALRSVDLG